MMASQFSDRVLAWFSQHGRTHLPWQVNPTPYRVWVSEIMLQQTQVAAVIPYYLRFMDAFPTLADLASASIDRVLGFWSGLGYYARARNLHRAAQTVMEKHQGQFPVHFDAVLALPGIGRSTAGAILAFSTEQRHAILDGNVKRILCRHEAFDAAPNTADSLDRLWAIAEQYTPHKQIAQYTQAIMDLGATLCTRTKPRCPDCPLQKSCKAYKLDRVSDFPIRIQKPKKPIQERFFLMIQSPQGFLLYQRPSTGIWGGLWSFPEWPVSTASKKQIMAYCQSLLKIPFKLLSLPTLQHHFTHYQLTLKPLLLSASTLKKHSPLFENFPTRWCTSEMVNTLGLPAPIKRLLLSKLQ
jgi:A/G-specific adenine glycosylase